MTARSTGSTITAPTATLDAHQVADRFERITAMIEAGNPGAARRATAALATSADDATAVLLRSCLQALERPRAVAIPLLRRLWQDTDPGGRALIEACVPRANAQPARATRPGPAQRRDAARGPVHEHTTRQGPVRSSRSRAGADQVRDAARYFAQHAEPGGVDALTDDLDREETSPDYPGWVDDESPALVPTRGTPCVSCWIERPTAEQRPRDDDGLCGECRDRGATGIATPGHDRTSRVHARVAHIAATAANTDQARPLLRGEYYRARGTDKALIVAWVHQHLPA